ncbi:class I SAM-dependent methyltransferase [Cylindrospermopsis raciborskii]|uniref:class I SAM-dependent methyltransferase n=1 Tax=Cylindrospermopsis raciborskii TaxID=77022 RepID=UPI000C9EBF8C|nr:class I SAM-dependent methyltransferase [Cylindrospermopsis raciborskii]PNK19151.1 hypothetical protein CEP07_06860 [Cylindrospermopsis raciborskii S01]
MKQEKIWQYYQNEGLSSFDNSRGRLEFLGRQIRKKLSGKARGLNIGVGNGSLEKIAISLGLDIWSLDPDNCAIERLSQELGMDGKAKVGYSQNLPFPDNFFDFIVVSEVLEHLSDDILDQSLHEFNRVLKSKGIIIGTVPARENLQDNIIICPSCGEKFHRWGHVQSFDTVRLFNLLSKHFKVEKIKEKCFFSTLNWKGKIVACIKMTMEKCGIFISDSEKNIYFLISKY